MKVNEEWAKAQFTLAGVRQGVGDAVLALLKTWEQIDLSEEMAADTIDVFSHLAQSQSLIKTPVNETWVACTPGGNTRVGATVRVKHNAFTGEAGIMHNGRVGRVTAIRSGDVIFRSTDGLDPFIDNSHYPFVALEQLIS